MNYGDDRTGLRIRGKRARSFWTGAVLMLGLIAAPDVVNAGGCAGRRPGADAGAGSRRVAGPTIAPARDALPVARRRQVRRHRSAARRQGRAGGRSQDRQCGRSVRRSAPISSAARSARPTSCSSPPTASRSPPTISRSSAISTACARRSADRCRASQIEGVGDGVDADRLGVEPGRGAAGRRCRGAARRQRRQGRQQHRRARPRPGDAEGRRRAKCAATSSSSWASISAPA